MFDTELYQQVLGLNAPWKVSQVRLDVEATEIHVHVEHTDGCSWECPQCHRELSCYDHVPERTWRHLNTCQFQTMLHARVARVECPEHGVVQVNVPWTEPYGRFTLLMGRFVIDVLHACRRLGNVITYCPHAITNAAAEGFNSKIMAINRRAGGYPNPTNFKTVIYFYCGGLRLYS